MIRSTLIAAILVISACDRPQPSSAVQDLSAQDLWVGAISYNQTRETSDICDKSHPIGNEDIFFGSWARQRAVYTNICFQVWKPGVTDQENPDFWKLLDVQVHTRYPCDQAFQTEYVNTPRRVGNNRQYVWDMRRLDPFMGNCSGSKANFKIIRDFGTEVEAEALLEVYFTVNGHEVRKADGWNYFIKYRGICPKVNLPN